MVKAYTVEEKIRFNTKQSGDCLVWNDTGMYGYGLTKINGVTKSAHRVCWEYYNNAKIPEGMVVMHSCDNRACVKKEHLSIGTQKENLRDARNKKRFPCYTQTHCKRGHELTLENLYKIRLPERICKLCAQLRAKNRRGDKLK